MDSTPEIIEASKQRMQHYLKEMKEPLHTYLLHSWKIEESKSTQVTPFIQTGVLIYESKDITHFIIPTSYILTRTTPYQYKYKVCVLNKKSGFFDTMYDGLEHECITYVLKFQEKKYGFSLKDQAKSHNWIVNANKELNDLALIVGDEFAEEHKKKVEDLTNEIRKNIGIPVE